MYVNIRCLYIKEPINTLRIDRMRLLIINMRV